MIRDSQLRASEATAAQFRTQIGHHGRMRYHQHVAIHRAQLFGHSQHPAPKFIATPALRSVPRYPTPVQQQLPQPDRKPEIARAEWLEPRLTEKGRISDLATKNGVRRDARPREIARDACRPL